MGGVVADDANQEVTHSLTRLSYDLSIMAEENVTLELLLSKFLRFLPLLGVILNILIQKRFVDLKVDRMLQR